MRAHERRKLPVGAHVPAVERAARGAGQVQRQREQVDGAVLGAMHAGEEKELVHDPDNAAIGGLGSRAGAHLGHLVLDSVLGHPVPVQHLSQRVREAAQHGARRRQRHEHRQQGRLADEQGRLGAPPGRGRVPRAKQRGAVYRGGYRRTYALKEPLRPVYDEHHRSLPDQRPAGCTGLKATSGRRTTQLYLPSGG